MSGWKVLYHFDQTVISHGEFHRKSWIGTTDNGGNKMITICKVDLRN